MVAGQRHLGGADQVLVIALEVVDLIGVLAQKAGARHDLRADQHRRDHQLEPSLAGLLRRQHHHAQLQEGAVAGEVVEAGAADLGATLDIDKPQRFTQVQVVLRLEVELSLLAVVLQLDEVVLAAGRGTLHDVGDLELQLADAFLGLALRGLGLLDLGLELVGALEQLRALLRGSLADLLTKRLLLAAQFIGSLDGRAALLVGFQQGIDQGGIFATVDL